MTDSYSELVERAGADYAAAAAEARAKNAYLVEAQVELDRMQSEVEALRVELADFEAGRAAVMMTAEEYQVKADRVRWLTGMIAGQRRIVAATQGAAAAAGGRVRDVHSSSRSKLETLLAGDVAALQARRRAELETVLR